MLFNCTYQNKNKLEKWTGRITNLKNYGSHYEMNINSRSGIIVLFGKTSMGNFTCMPDFRAGCHLAEFDNVFYNNEKLSYCTNPIDGITIAKALEAFTKIKGNI